MRSINGSHEEFPDAVIPQTEVVHSVLDSLNDAVWSVSVFDGGILYISKAAEDVFGAPVEGFYSDPILWMDIVHPEDREKVEDFLLAVYENGAAAIEYRIIRSGGVRWVQSKARLDSKNGAVINGVTCDITESRNKSNALRQIVEGVTNATGDAFFRSLVKHLAGSLEVEYAFVAMVEGTDDKRARTVEIYANGEYVDNFVYDLEGTPCHKVSGGEMCCYPRGVQSLFPEDRLLADMGVESYIGVPLLDTDGHPLGIMVALGAHPIQSPAFAESMLMVFAERASAELQRLKREEDLKNSHERLLSILHSIDAVVYVADMGTHEILFVNKYIEDIFGDIVGKTCWQELQRGQTGPCSFCTNDKLSKPKSEVGEVYVWEFQNTVNNRWYSIRDRAIRWIDGRIVRLEIATDITESKRAEEKLLQSHERLELSVRTSAAELLEANRELETEIIERKRVLGALSASNTLLENVFKTVNNLIAYMDRDFNFIRVNDAYANADGHDPEYYVGKNHFDLFPHEENEVIFRRVVDTGEPYTVMAKPFIFPLNPERGVSYWDWSLQPVKEPSGEVTGLVLSLLNVTERKLAEDELLKAKERAEEATLLKDKFVSLVAHDLKSPFASIMGLLNVMYADTREPLPDKHKETASRILARGEGLVSMIEDLLNISRLKTGMIKPKPQFLNASVMVASVVDGHMHSASKKGIEIENRIPEGTRLYADRNLFVEVLRNLVSNAVKFCGGGGRVTIFMPEGKNSAIAVKDTGVGVNRKMLPDLFKHEVKTTTTGTAGEKGTGLGLPFSHEIMEAHGGKLYVESVEGEGATFYAELPDVKPAVLIVDDSRTDRAILKAYLRNVDAEVLEASNGREALGIVEKSKPHLVIADIEMPEMNGFGLLEELKKNEDTKYIPVIVITSGNSMETREQALRMGASDFATKPIPVEDFIPRVRRYI